jgi:hypothetical protein
MVSAALSAMALERSQATTPASGGIGDCLYITLIAVR